MTERVVHRWGIGWADHRGSGTSASFVSADWSQVTCQECLAESDAIELDEGR